jgi:hypothetical protein
MALKVHVQQRDTLLYYRSDGQWVKEMSEAHDFQQVLAAGAHFPVHLTDLQLDVVLRFSDSDTDIRIPLTAVRRPDDDSANAL